MDKIYIPVRRRLHRVGVALLIAGVLISIVTGWVLSVAHAAVQWSLQKLGLGSFEAWLKRRGIWCPVLVLGVMLAGLFAFKVYELHLLMQKHFTLAISLGLVFKVSYMGILNYFGHLFAPRFLAYGWIRRGHDRYMRAREHALAWLHRREWYRRAMHLKELLRHLNRRSMLSSARRLVKRWGY